MYKKPNNTNNKIVGASPWDAQKTGGGTHMIKKIAWNTFKNTGSIDTFLELKEIEGIEEKLEENVNENSKNKWSSNSGENNRRF